MRTRTESAFHPITRAALFRSPELEALDLKRLADQIVQIHSAGDHVAAKYFRRTIPNVKFEAKLVVNLLGKESDLTLVVFAETKITVSLDSFAGDTLNLVNFLRGMAGWLFPVVADKVVAR